MPTNPALPPTISLTLVEVQFGEERRYRRPFCVPLPLNSLRQLSTQVKTQEESEVLMCGVCVHLEPLPSYLQEGTTSHSPGNRPKQPWRTNHKTPHVNCEAVGPAGLCHMAGQPSWSAGRGLSPFGPKLSLDVARWALMSCMGAMSCLKAVWTLWWACGSS